LAQFLVKWSINIISLYVVINTIAGVTATNTTVLIIAALIIGLLNATLRPALIALTLPLTISSLGLFTLVINAFMLFLASRFVPGFNVANFWSAMWAGLLFSFISFVLNIFLSPGPFARFRVNTFSNTEEAPGRIYDTNVIDVVGEVVEKSKEDEGE